MGKVKKIKLDELEEKERVKYEIADELGLLDQVMENGWKSLTSKETGRIGGLVTKRLYRNDKKPEQFIEKLGKK